MALSQKQNEKVLSREQACELLIRSVQQTYTETSQLLSRLKVYTYSYFDNMLNSIVLAAYVDKVDRREFEQLINNYRRELKEDFDRDLEDLLKLYAERRDLQVENAVLQFPTKNKPN